MTPEEQNRIHASVLQGLRGTVIPVGHAWVRLGVVYTDYELSQLAGKLLQGVVDDEQLAVVRGVCPFPAQCNLRESCTLKRCNADVCSNGFAYRYS